MKKLIIVLFAALAMASCSDSRYITEMTGQFEYTVYDGNTATMYFTNRIEPGTVECSIRFIDHHGVTVELNHYTVEHNKPTP